MRVLGFLNKNDPKQFEQLLHEFRTSHFFILPTLYEAYGLVFCEAAAYGLPTLAPETGGIPTIIQHNKTGFLLPPGSNGTAYAKPILELLRQPELWQTMRKAARKRYLEKLNWRSWTNEFKQLIDTIGIQ
jgi:glycosyltransferase involved in cell wall biosynthesis